jgi:hypothetical protein
VLKLCKEGSREVSGPGARDCTRGTLLLRYGMGYDPRFTFVVTTCNIVGLLVQ